ncbi:MAG: heavy metal-associated domain-containing protein [Candidatus Woesebacteria bacterium]
MQQTITLSGLTCPACKKVTEKRIGKLDGVTSVNVSLETGIATIEALKELSVVDVQNVLQDTPYSVVEK